MARKKSQKMDTRGALIDALLALVGQEGFESTSVDAIVARAGLSKGTFFHYFPTKDALLDASCERLAEQGWKAVEPAFDGPGTPVEKLAGYLVTGRRFRLERAGEVGGVWDALAHEPNAPLRAKVGKAYRARVGPRLRDLVAQGAASGQLRVDDAPTVADLILEFVEASAEGTMRRLRAGGPDAAEQAARRVNATLTAVEKILGAEQGVLQRTCAAALDALRKPAAVTSQESGSEPRAPSSPDPFARKAGPR